ncbi:geranylgeranylglyceryl phosphate synthase [Neptunitalea chrysea]|uniref:Geranylgeranylglyceryl phosphate synthase n=1 Tax=Neptunitalea chrysea TaxID=1647581 RepID=A0A9W6B4S9_9FLAO|nr:geranylgeranylglyceryl/heptaprenylglyceryl phosphate synthase [Neptunitalea chrysea]GLB52653.1 geranylgeranylglyceryl phosphate synthase [Neptunitalea chrysea]
MMSYYNLLIQNKEKNTPLLAVLIDPDKMNVKQVPAFVEKMHKSPVSIILVGGSTVLKGVTEPLVKALKKHTQNPVFLFPGDVNQLTNEADVLLFLMLLSGRNPEYLIGQQIASVPFLRDSALEVISTGYILLDGGKETATMKVTHTHPLPLTDIQLIKDTAKAGELIGNKLLYLEAGSGANHPVPSEVINAVREEVSIPVIVGGGIRTEAALLEAIKSKADMIVIGTAFEQDINFFETLQNLVISKTI